MKRFLLQTVLSVLALAPAGCGGTAPDADRYTPDTDAARRALDAALLAWKQGEAPGRVETADTTVHVVDSERLPGQALEAFEILGEIPSDGPRCLSVRLVLGSPPGEERARFVIVGRDPLWVFRESDYLMMAHWEHAMPDPAVAPGSNN